MSSSLVSASPEVSATLRDLRKKLDRGANTMKLVKNGDLKILNDAEKRTVEMFPKWTEQLNYIREHNALPPPPPPPAAAAAASEEEEVACTVASSAAVPTSTTPPTSTVNCDNADGTVADTAAGSVAAASPTKKGKKSKSSKGGGGGGSAATAVPHLVAKDVVSLASMVVSTGDHRQARRALIDNFISSQLDHASLSRLTKEYDDLCSLRRDMVAGRISKPTNVQKARIELIPVLQREMQLEKSKMDSQTSRLRLHIKATIADVIGCDEADIDELGYEVIVVPTTPPPPPQPTGAVAKGEDVVVLAQEEDAGSAAVAPQEDAVAEDATKVANSVVPEVNAPEVEEVTATVVEEEKVLEVKEEQPQSTTTDGDNAAKPSSEVKVEKDGEKEEEPASTIALADMEEEEEAAVEDEPVKEEKVAVEVQEEQVEEEEVEALPPPPPKEIDWSDITIIKNRIELHQTVLTPVGLADMRRRRENSRDPSAARRRSASAANRTGRVNPFVMDALTLSDVAVDKLLVTATTGTDSTKTNKGKSVSNKGKQGGGGGGGDDKGAPTKPTPSSPSLTTLQTSVVSRVLRDLKFCQRNALRTVRFEADETDVRCWYINVSPIDGPVAGSIIPLQMRFGDLYPQEAPVVQCMVSIPHSSIVNSRNLRDTLCFDHTRDSEWSPNFGAFSVLSQLQTFFSTESFNGSKKGSSALSTAALRQKLAVPLADLSRYSNAAIAHFPAHPYPPISVFNGPFSGKTQVKLNESGELSGPGSATWLHAFAGEGSTHSFTCKVIVPPTSAATSSPKQRRNNNNKKVPSTKKATVVNDDASNTTTTATDGGASSTPEDISSASSPVTVSTPTVPSTAVDDATATATPTTTTTPTTTDGGGGGSFIVGVVAPNGAGADRIGGDEYGWAFNTADGSLKHNNKISGPFGAASATAATTKGSSTGSDEEGNANTTTVTPSKDVTSSSLISSSGAPLITSLNAKMFPLRHGASIAFIVNLSTNTMDIIVDGIVVHAGVSVSKDIFTPPQPSSSTDDGNAPVIDADLDGHPTHGLHPVIYFPQLGISAELELTLHAKSLAAWQIKHLSTSGLASPRSARSESARRGTGTTPSLDASYSSTPLRSTSSRSIKTMPPASSAGTLALPKLSQGRIATPGTVSMDTGSSKAAADIEVALDVLGLKPLRCFVSLASQSEAPLGLLLEVAQDTKTFTPINVSSRNSSYISADAFVQYTNANKSQNSRRSQTFFPLMLGAAHAAKSIPSLKTAITNMCRNPNASTAYTPPFKPHHVATVISSALFSVVDELAEQRLSSAKATSFTHLLHAALALMQESEEVRRDFESIIAVVKGGESAKKADVLSALPSEKHIILAIALSNVAYPPSAIGAMANEDWIKYLKGCVELASNNYGGGPGPADVAESADPLAALPVKRRKAVLRAIVFATAIRQSIHAAVLSTTDPCKTPFEALCALGGFLRFSDLVWVKANEAKLSNLSRWAAISTSIMDALEE